MTKIANVLAGLLILIVFSAKAQSPTGRIVLISTNYGDMKVKLYDETPKSRDNFVKLVEKGFYDSLLFHRVIKEFMIQGGDPDSKNAAPGMMLGGGDVGYTVPAEFNDSLFHKKGALCAARMENPEKAGSGCQFYIVHGKKYTDAELDNMELNINQNIRLPYTFQSILSDPKNAALREQYLRYQQNSQRDSINALVATTIQPMINKKMKMFKYSPSQRATYKTLGGTPVLDQNYTVFGEVIEGMDVIDKIATTPTGQADRPVTDVVMKMKVVK